jgi:hypothetical protein
MDKASERGEAPPAGVALAAPSRKTKAQRTEANARVQMDNAAEAPKGAAAVEALPEAPDVEVWPEEPAKE